MPWLRRAHWLRCRTGTQAPDFTTQATLAGSECRSKFAVAADADKKIMKAYDAQLFLKPDWAKRTSYVIAPSGEILYSYNSLNPDKHVAIRWRR